MLKRIEIAGYGPYVCGRTKATGDILPPPLFSSVAGAPIYHDVDAIRAAAKSMRPIYAAVENIMGNDKYGDCTCCGALIQNRLQTVQNAAASVTANLAMFNAILLKYLPKAAILSHVRMVHHAKG